jgi:hypothetical protein
MAVVGFAPGDVLTRGALLIWLRAIASVYTLSSLVVDDTPPAGYGARVVRPWAIPISRLRPAHAGLSFWCDVPPQLRRRNARLHAARSVASTPKDCSRRTDGRGRGALLAEGRANSEMKSPDEKPGLRILSRASMTYASEKDRCLHATALPKRM